MEFLNRSFNTGARQGIPFFRDKTGHEVDFLLADGSRVQAFEIKSSSTYRRDYLDDVRYFRELVGSRLTDAHLLYAGTEDARVDGIRVRNAIRHFMEE